MNIVQKLANLQTKLGDHFNCECRITLEDEMIYVLIDDTQTFHARFTRKIFEEYYEGNIPEFFDLIVSMYYNSGI